jgi:hypothetical protein
MITSKNSGSNFIKRINYIARYKSQKSTVKNNDYSNTLNLPNAGKFELSMKKICEHEDKIKKV